MTISRRYFLAAFSAFAVSPLLAALRVEPEVILFNGRIWTVDDNLPRAEALAVSDGRVFAIGTNQEVLALATAGTRKIDLFGNFSVAGSVV
jgi:predicted amidohydrolase YtcJ